MLIFIELKQIWIIIRLLKFNTLISIESIIDLLPIIIHQLKYIINNKVLITEQ